MQYFKKQAAAIGLGLASLMVAGSASALPVYEWGFNIAGQWQDITSENGACTTSGTSPCSNFNITPGVVSWSDNDGDTSSLSLTNNPAIGQVLTIGFNGVTTGTPGAIGADHIVTHNNQPLDAGTNSLTSVVLNATVQLTPINPAASTLPDQIFDFPIKFIETSNNGGNDSLCEDGNAPPANGCEDIFVLEGGLLNPSFDYDGFTYFVNIFPTDLNVFSLLSSGECASAGAAPGCVGFITPENASTPFQFAFTISSEPLTTSVPVPGTLVLLGLGLLGFRFADRRKKSIK